MMEPTPGIYYGDPQVYYRDTLARLRALCPGLRSLWFKRGPFFAKNIPLPCWETIDGMLIIGAIEVKSDGREWLHMSFSRKDRLPDYDDQCKVRERFFPEDAVVLQVFPPKGEHVNIHTFTLHLWSRLGEDRLVPDLRLVSPLGKGI